MVISSFRAIFFIVGTSRTHLITNPHFAAFLLEISEFLQRGGNVMLNGVIRGNMLVPDE